MSITTDLDTIKADYEQAEIAMKYRRIFKDVAKRLTDLDAEVEQVASDTTFNAIPASVKQALNKYWQLVKSFNSAIVDDADITELLTYGEPPHVEGEPIE